MTQVSVVIPTRDARPWLVACLEALKQAAPASSEVLVVDRASEDDTVRTVAREFGHVRLLRAGQDDGPAGARNRGFAAARGAYVLFLDPRVELLPGALRPLVDFLEQNLRHGAAVPRLCCPDGRTEPAHRGLPTLGTAAWLGTPLARRDPGSRELRRFFACEFDYEQDGDVEDTSPACFLMRRRALKGEAVVDPALVPGFEQTDLCRRLRRAGWRIRYLVEACAVHHAGRAEVAWPEMTSEWHARRLAYYRKHLGPASGAWVKACVGWIVADHFAREMRARIKGLGRAPLLPVWREYAGLLRA